MSIELTHQEIDFIKTLIEETVLDDDAFDMTTKTVAKNLISKLNEE